MGPDELTELRVLSPSQRKAFLDRVSRGSIRSTKAVASTFTLQIPRLSAGQFLRYCRVCYAAAFPAKDKEEPATLYRAFADGRHGGLLSIDQDDQRAFARWFASDVYAGSHPFEIVRDWITLSVHPGSDGGYWLRLSCRRREFVCPYLIRMALGLSRAGVPFGLENLAACTLFANGDDWIGVVDDQVWDRGSPVWPPHSGVLNAAQNSFLVSELAKHPALMRRVRWFNTPVQVAKRCG